MGACEYDYGGRQVEPGPMMRVAWHLVELVDLFDTYLLVRDTPDGQKSRPERDTLGQAPRVDTSLSGPMLRKREQQ